MWNKLCFNRAMHGRTLKTKGHLQNCMPFRTKNVSMSKKDWDRHLRKNSIIIVEY